MDQHLAEHADRVAHQIGERTVACAESFTAGLVAQSLAAGQQASEWFCGGVVAYQEKVKRSVLGVQSEHIVSETAAVEMAEGAARLLGAQVGIATTGVAGPDDQDGVMAGTIVVGWIIDGSRGAQTFHLPGDPEAVVVDGARLAMERLCAVLDGSVGPG